MIYPKRLIEVDLPIARISAHARREKSIRHGHISTLHIWWARRPLAACRAVICAALWPDPADPNCPRAFIEAAATHLTAFAKRVNPEMITEEKHRLQATVSHESRGRWEALAAGALTLDADDPSTGFMLQLCLLDFIADFANWDSSTVPAYLETSRALTQAAHEALGGVPGTRPLVVDPFAGGGSIPLEALRVGADAFASDLNPVPVLLNKVLLEYVPKFGNTDFQMKDASENVVTFHGLADAVRYWGGWIKEQAESALAPFYPKDAEGSSPIAYLWARTILSEAPGQGETPVEIPLLRSMWLCKKSNRKIALRWVTDGNGTVQTESVKVTYSNGVTQEVRRPLLEVFQPQRDSEVLAGTSRGGGADCPVSHHTTPSARVRAQLFERHTGTSDSRLLAVVNQSRTEDFRTFRVPNAEDALVVARCKERLREHPELAPPNESLPSARPSPNSRGLSPVARIGAASFADLFPPRASLSLATAIRSIHEIAALQSEGRDQDAEVVDALIACLSLAVGRGVDFWSSCATWNAPGEFIGHAFTRQSLSVVWDYAECNPWAKCSGNWEGAVDWIARVLESTAAGVLPVGMAAQASATAHPLPDDSCIAVVTDPPYHDAVPYADLSDFFYVWIRRAVGSRFGGMFAPTHTPKTEEAICNPSRMYTPTGRPKDDAFYTWQMTRAFTEARRVVSPKGIGVVVFASKTTSSWETVIQAILDAGWVVTGSWPIDSERGARMAAQGQARLASSVHVVCRPREDSSGTVTEAVGEWRDVLGELQPRIHEWMPRLAAEGVVGADAIFACLGPALEVFSRYCRVEKANGDPATLREYLEFVWAAVSTEALALIFKDADASGLEPDARMTAMWLWTLGGGTANGNGKSADSDDEHEAEDEEESSGSGSKSKATGGFTLEFDAARKIAQGLGVHLEQSSSLVEIKGDKARLLPVAERTTHLFGNAEGRIQNAEGKWKKGKQQQSLFEELNDAESTEEGWTEIKGPPPGTTVLDRVHQAMILFAANRGELLKRFLVEDGVGKDARFWKLADNLNKLYPPGTEERRWVEGVLARKKGLGL